MGSTRKGHRRRGRLRAAAGVVSHQALAIEIHVHGAVRACPERHALFGLREPVPLPPDAGQTLEIILAFQEGRIDRRRPCLVDELP